MHVDYSQLPNTARVWVYQVNRNLTNQEADFVEQQLKAFSEKWVSHQIPINTSYKLIYNRFIVLLADESKGVSGCSIDSSVAIIRHIESELGVTILDNKMQIIYLADDNMLKDATMAEFKSLLSTEKLSNATTVFNNLVKNKQELEESWQTNVANSWHKQLV